MASDPSGRLFDRATPPHILTLIMLAAIGAMNMAIFLPSLPAMTEYFATSYEIMQLAVSLYLLLTGVLQLVIGPLADRYGRRLVTLWAMAIFVVASFGCILATSIEVFMACRMAQASVVTGIALSRAVVRDMYPPNQAASMIGYVTGSMALVPMLAPMVGGALELGFGWRGSFWVLAISGMLVFALAWSDMGETNPGSGSTFGDQMRDMPELFGSQRFWGYVLAAAFASGSFFAFLGGAPLVATEVYGLSAFWAGVGFGAPATGYMTGSFLSGRFAARVGINKMVLIGTMITATGIGIGAFLHLVGLGSAYVFFLACTSIGLGNGLVVPNASAGLLSVRPRLAGTASGVGGAAMIGGGSLLSMLAGVVLTGGGGALSLMTLMLTTSLLANAAIVFVIRRAAHVGEDSAG
ncbi:MAG: multidrug effflux MFS transporter [Pseudomonadota bacterium]